MGGIGFSRLLRLRAGCLDHLAPLLGLVGNHLAEVGRRACHHVRAEFDDALRDLGIGKAGIDLAVELVDDLSRRVARYPAPYQDSAR